MSQGNLSKTISFMHDDENKQLVALISCISLNSGSALNHIIEFSLVPVTKVTIAFIDRLRAMYGYSMRNTSAAKSPTLSQLREACEIICSADEFSCLAALAGKYEVKPRSFAFIVPYKSKELSSWEYVAILIHVVNNRVVSIVKVLSGDSLTFAYIGDFIAGTNAVTDAWRVGLEPLSTVVRNALRGDLGIMNSEDRADQVETSLQGLKQTKGFFARLPFYPSGSAYKFTKTARYIFDSRALTPATPNDAPEVETSATGTSETPKHDMVVNPAHYQLLPNIEVIDVRHAWLAQMEGKGYPLAAVCGLSEALTYLMRFHTKNGVEDLKKARQYLNLAINIMEGHPERKFNYDK